MHAARKSAGHPSRATDHTGNNVSLVLVRHGQSTWNAARRWQGTADPPLTHLGWAQARAQAESLTTLTARSALVMVGSWASPLRRAADTAEVLARALALGPVRHDTRLREAFAGEWEGMTPDEITETWPGYLQRGLRPPSFEPDATVEERAWRAATGIADHIGDLPASEVPSGHRAALVVTHSGLLRRLSARAGFTAITVSNLGGYRLRLRRPERGGEWTAEGLEMLRPADRNVDRASAGAD